MDALKQIAQNVVNWLVATAKTIDNWRKGP